MMKTCSRDLLQQMTETYKTRIAGTDDFRSTLDALFFTALRAARESDTLRQFDCFKEAERYLLRIAASSYLSGLMAGMASQESSALFNSTALSPAFDRASFNNV